MKKQLLYIEDRDAIAEDEIYFLSKQYEVTRPPLKGENLAQALIDYLLNPDYRFDVLLQDLHLDHFHHGDYYDERIHKAVLSYKQDVNSKLCWLILTGTADVEKAKELYHGVDGAYHKFTASGDNLLEIIKSHLESKADSANL